MVKLNRFRRENSDVYQQSWGLICDAYNVPSKCSEILHVCIRDPLSDSFPSCIQRSYVVTAICFSDQAYFALYVSTAAFPNGQESNA